MGEFDAIMKKREKEAKSKFATVGSVQARYEDVKEEVDAALALASDAYGQVKELEQRLRLVVGPIPNLDPKDPFYQAVDEGESNWN